MLDPEGRHLLLDALRPPNGYELDIAVGTTYTLDLYALLTAPVAFAMFDRETGDGTPWTDPVAALQALRRYANRITLFCQAGGITVPRDYRSLVVYLESSIVPVVPPNPESIFHPKVWLIRFRSTSEAPHRFRLLCMSRNLTFDRSWDTILRLEGEPSETVQHTELRDFVTALPRLAEAVRPLPPDRHAAVDDLGAQLERVRWAGPDGLEVERFWALGHDGRPRWPFTGRSDRFFVVSPFVTAGALSRLTKRARGSTLLSRPETFDRLGGTATGHLRERLVLSADAHEPATEPPDGSESESPAAVLEGLHAKLVVADIPYGGRVWTGSANLTDAAFGGNVEFITELRGRKRTCGIEATIGDQASRLGLRKLVEPYEPASAEGRPLTESEWLEAQLDHARRILGRLRYRAVCDRHERNTFALALDGTAAEDVQLDPAALADLSITVRPVSLGEGAAIPVEPGPRGLTATYQLSYEAITPFFAFHVRPTDATLEFDTSFLINAELIGAPNDRAENVMVGLLKDRAALIRFLLLLLGDVDAALAAMAGEGPSMWDGRGAWANAATSEALLEPLMRAYSRDRSRLLEIQHVMSELSKTETGREILPDGWDSVWSPIEAALASDGQP